MSVGAAATAAKKGQEIKTVTGWQCGARQIQLQVDGLENSRAFPYFSPSASSGHGCTVSNSVKALYGSSPLLLLLLGLAAAVAEKGQESGGDQ